MCGISFARHQFCNGGLIISATCAVGLHTRMCTDYTWQTLWESHIPPPQAHVCSHSK